MKEIIKALGFDPLPTAIITIQLTVIWFFLRNFYKTQKANQQETQKNILENFLFYIVFPARKVSAMNASLFPIIIMKWKKKLII